MRELRSHLETSPIEIMTLASITIGIDLSLALKSVQKCLGSRQFFLSLLTTNKTADSMTIQWQLSLIKVLWNGIGKACFIPREMCFPIYLLPRYFCIEYSQWTLCRGTYVKRLSDLHK